MNFSEQIEYQKQTCLITLGHLFDKYQDDEYMLSKLNNYILIQLPKLMENHKISQHEKQAKKTELNNEKSMFQTKFLTDNRFYYLTSNETFFHYDGNKYTTYNEDDICHKIFTQITKERKLMAHKEKVKNSIINKIKKTSLFKTIPESKTIQNTLNMFYPTLFNSKDKAKYFLTIIGDNLLKIENQLVHLINPKAKHFLKELTHYSYLYTSVNPTNTFKYKYHDQDYSCIRLLDINMSVDTSTNWSFVKHQIINILSVACYYSNRFNKSDNFIESHCNYTLSNYTLFLKNNTSRDIVNLFSSYYIENCTESNINFESCNYNIPWKHMVYLWKIFLEGKNFPNIIFNQNLKVLLCEKYQFNHQLDQFTGVTSKYLPRIAAFMEFWNDAIIQNDDEELEIGEINSIFKQWTINILKNKSISNYCNDQQILDIIRFYFPETEINEDKYVMNISCKLWDKNNEVSAFLTCHKEKFVNNSPHSAYEIYVKSQPNLVASKRYFMEKYNLFFNSE